MSSSADSRFARLKTDPRFRKPQKQQNKVVVDKRFKSVFSKKKNGQSKARVDKYGLPLSENHEQDNLKRFYRLQDSELDDQPTRPDYARGEVLLESSDEEEDEEADQSSDSDQDDAPVIIGRESLSPDLPEDAEINLDEDELADLDAQAAAYSRQVPQESQPQGDRTNRIAVVNLDWDHVRAIHLYKVFSSLVSPTAPPLRKDVETQSSKGIKVAQGSILDVTVYPSEFGKQRMAREDKEGPPAEVFKKRKKNQEINEQTIFELGGEEDVDENALRRYQLERLRYYYAIVTCSSVEAASHCYSELDGTEFERSANVFDLSFVPDDIVFDEDFRDKATSDADSYKPLEFSTDALRHSKVKLTWDEDDNERTKVTKRALSKKDIDVHDFSAYLASGSESEGEAPSSKTREPPSRDALRALLLEGNDDNIPEGWGRDDDFEDDKDVDMEITFTSGLSGKKEGEETTLDAYKRKMKEKRKKRKEKTQTPVVEEEEDVNDDFFGNDDDDDESASSEAASEAGPSSRSVDEKTRPVATVDDLSSLVNNDPSHATKHFDLKAVIKAEKGGKGRRSKKGKQRAADQEDETQQDFSIDVVDNRFSALHEDPAYAIDPSNPHFKKTKGMSALLDERSKRQAGKRRRSPSPGQTIPEDGNLHDLVNSVKRHSSNQDKRPGKRRR